MPLSFKLSDNENEDRILSRLFFVLVVPGISNIIVQNAAANRLMCFHVGKVKTLHDFSFEPAKQIHISFINIQEMCEFSVNFQIFHKIF